MDRSENWSRMFVRLDNARVNRADEKCKLVKIESDTMVAKRTSDDWPNAKLEYASVQRFVIPAADGFRALILTAKPN